MRSMWGIISRVLPEGERDAAEALGGVLKQLEATTAEFISAIVLFNETRHLARDEKNQDRREIVSRWPFIAARTGALCLYDFYQSTQAINQTLLHRCPSIKERVDMEEKKKGQSLLTNFFPTHGAIRTAAAHPGEINSTPDKSAANQVVASAIPHLVRNDGPEDVKINITNSLIGDQYTCTFEGKLVGYGVNEGSAKALEAVLNHWQNAFESAVQYTRDLRDQDILKSVPKAG